MNRKYLFLPGLALIGFLVFQGIGSFNFRWDVGTPAGVPSALAAENKQAGFDKTTPAAPRLPAMIDLGKTQCIPCKMMAPVLEELKRDYAGVLRIEFIDVGEYLEAAVKYSIRGIPTQIFFDASGKELERHLGYISKEQILDTFKKLGVDVNKKPQQQKK
jgi:thioredoxin 1